MKMKISELEQEIKCVYEQAILKRTLKKSPFGLIFQKFSNTRHKFEDLSLHFSCFTLLLTYFKIAHAMMKV